MRPAGIGGWLLLPAIGLILSPVVIVVALIRDLLPAMAPDVWNALTDPTSEAYHAMWAPVILFELFANVSLLVLTAWLAYLFFSRSGRAPRLFILWLSLNLAIQVIDLLLVQSIPALAEQNDPSSTRELVRAFVGAAIWIPYFLRSERVRNTFGSSEAS